MKIASHIAPKHVIFLGAGASCTSGYPIGQELRLLMSSRNHFAAKVQELYAGDVKMVEQVCEYFDRFTESIDLFRHGGFATVDEFSKLASGSYPEHVQNMKMLMRLVLALHNPEDSFHDSDYYPFIQRLFRGDSLNLFRNEIAIITYNYDCYLDYVMHEAYRHRQCLSTIPKSIKDNPQVLKGPQELVEPWTSKLSSGFSTLGMEGQMAWRLDQFNYFKLHGSITNGNDPIAGYQALFAPPKGERFNFLKDPYFRQTVPPVAFPWELFSSSGVFIPEDEFIFVKENEKHPQKLEQGRLIFRHFKSMWENAKAVVGQAQKISFVGLSMHDYLEDGLKFLFDDTGVAYAKGQEEKEVQVVVANTANKDFENSSNRLHPASPCGRAANLLRKYAPNIKFIRSASEDDGMFRGGPEDKTDPNITPRYTFRDFIEREMK